ncbi:MAG: hypothetical protein JWQ28_2621 [Pedobacter sp.]|jgi:hypothetical protein|nr:hypothetical protein [Pedobacter sp.]
MKTNYKLVHLLVLLCAITIFSCKKTDNAAFIPEEKQTVVLTGDITTNTELDSKNNYVLKGRVYVKNNVTLTIPQGVTVVAEASGTPDTKAALIVTSGSKLNINGTLDQPVVFTSGAPSKAAGDWIGIIVLGKASTNGVAGKLNVSGLPVSADTEFGGTTDDDNSGSIKYLRLEYAGGLNPAMETEWALDQASGLSLNGVGSGTVLENVMVKYSNDDAFQFVGGTVNGKYLVAYNNGDDNFDFDRGYRGNLQFLISYRSVPSTVAIRANGMESLNDMDASDAMPYTRPVISNMTIIGPSADQPEADQSQGIYIRRNTRFDVQNSIIAGYSNGGLMLCPKTKPILVNNLGSVFKFNLVNSDDPTRAFTYDNGPTGVIITPDAAVAAWAIESDQSSIEKPSLNRNVIVNQLADLKVKTVYAAGGSPDLTPAEGSAALTGANLEDSDFASFAKVTYRGAVGPSDTWALASAWLDWN